MSKTATVRKRGVPFNRSTFQVLRFDMELTYTVHVDHLSHDQLCSFIEFLELVYGSRVKIVQTNITNIHQLDIAHMSISEVGLRVASRLYAVPIEGISYIN